MLSSLDGAREGVRQTARDIEESGLGIEDMFKRIGAAAGIAFSIDQAKSFINKIAEVRSYFQDIESTMEVFLGNQQKAAQFTQELKDYAYYNMFDFAQLADAAKQMIAYGHAVDDVIPRLDQLSNIATGTKADLMELVNLYNRAKNLGSVGSEGLASWATRGLVVKDVLKEMGQEVDGAQVSFEQLNMVLDKVTGEGGMFHDLMLNQMENISAEQGQLQDNLDAMYNEIGEKYQDLITGFIRAESWLVENYKEVGKTIAELIGIYGTYKAALIVANAIGKVHNMIVAETALQKKLAAAAGVKLTMAEAKEIATTQILNIAKQRLLLTTKQLTAAMLANPYVLVAMAVTGLAFGIYKLATAEDAETLARRRANEEMQTFMDKIDETKNRINTYIQTLQDSNATEYQKAVAWEQLNKLAPSLCENYSKAELATIDLGEATKAVNEEMEKAEIEGYKKKVQEFSKEIEKRAKDIEKWQKEYDKYRNASGYEVGSQDYDKKQRAQRAIDAQRAAIASLNTQMSEYQRKLYDIEQIHNRIEMENKPLEIRIEEANSNIKAKEEIYAFYRRAADLAGELKNANDAATGAIANNSIPYDYEKIADETKEKYDALIEELEKDVEELRTKVAESPADIKLQIELEEKQKVLQDILDMKAEWAWSGATTIPLVFQINYSSAENALNAAKQGQGVSTNGMKWVEDGISLAGGHWEKDDAHADTRTAKGWRTQAYNKWKDAEKAVSDFWNKKEGMDQETFNKEYDRLRKIADKAKKDYDKLNPRGKTFKKNNTADRIEKEQQKLEDLQDNLEDLQDDLDLKRLRSIQDMETRLTNIRLHLKEEGAEKVRLLQEQQNKEEIDNLKRQREDAIREYIEGERRLFEQKERIKKTKNSKYKEKKFDESKVDTSAIAQQYDELISLTQQNQLQTSYQESLRAMRDYLKEYGSFEQQRLATTEEYEEKILKATTQGEKLRLQKERDRKLGSLEYENIAAGIDWKALFSGVGSLSKEMMQPMMDKLMAYTKTDEYLNADSQTQQNVADLIQELRQYLGTDQSMTWQALGKATQDFMAAVGKYNQAVEDERAAVQRLEQAKLDLKAGKITQAAFDAIKADADKFGKTTQEAKESMEGFGTVLNDTSEQVSNYTSKLTAALNNSKGWTGIEGFSGVQQAVGQIDAFKGALDSALPSMGDGMGKTISEGLSSVIGSGLSSMGSGLTSILSSGLGKTIGFVAQIPRLILDLMANVKQFVVGVLNSFTELISLRWIDDLVVSITDAIGNLINAIFDLPENLFKVLEGIVVNGIGGLLNNVVGRIGNILSFGALSSGGPAEWFTNSNAKEVADTINRLTEENKNLEQAIDDLKGEMEKSRGAAAIDISRRAAELQEQTNENYRQMAQAQAGYHGDHHSWNYYWGGYNQEQINRLSNQIGRQWNGDIWDLSPEEMQMLRSNVDMWNQIKNSGESYYGGAVQEKLNDYIDQAGKLQEITDALYENLTTTTRDNVFDDFLNSLYDLADGSEDVFDNIADEWQKMVNKMVINNLIGDKFKKKLDGWYEELAKLNEAKANGMVSNMDYRDRLDVLKAQYEGYMRNAERDIATLRDEGIIRSTKDSTFKQEVSTKGFNAMGQNVGEELSGRFTSLQISGDSIAAHVASIYTQMIAMTAIHSSSDDTLSEIRNLMMTGNSYLEDIAQYSKKICLNFAKKIDNIVSNTSNM